VPQPQPPQAQAPPVYPPSAPVQEVSAPPMIPVVQSNDAPGPSNGQSRANPVHTAAASMETVQRALGDLRGSNGAAAPAHGGRGGRRGHHGHGAEREIKVPATDFDFQTSNARFDKTAMAPKKKDGEDENGVTSEPDSSSDKREEEGAYNPTKSFFDSLSSSAQVAPPPARGHGGRRGGGGRNRREEERERNVATFGEPGGVGLMGPGAYVGGWGGFGRRGGRPRRGVPPVGGQR
jgi:protein LSM14